MTLKKAISTKNVKAIRDITSSKPTSIVADMLEQLEEKERLVFFRLLGNKVQSEVFSALEDDFQERLVQLFTNEDMKDVFQDLHADEIANLIEEVPKNIADRILKNTPQERISDVKKILRYKDDVAGSFMTVEILTFKRSLTVGEVIKQIKSKREEIYVDKYIFVTDSKGVLVGFVTIDDIMFSQNTKRLKSFYKPSGFVYTTTDVNESIRLFADNDMSVLPVVDSSKKIVGIITSDDMIDITREEADSDFQKMSGINYDDTPYSRISIKKLFRSRVLWLMLLMISSTVSQIVLDSFQSIANSNLDGGNKLGITSAIWTTAIVAILPVISGAAGNAGSQASTTIIRGLATGDITSKDYKKVIFKEFKVSTCIGFTLGIANFIRLIIYYAARGDLSGDWVREYIFLSLAASLSLMVVTILAKIVGGTLPLIAKILKLDPAVMAAPLLTTLIDALSTMIFFGISIGIMYMVL